MKIITLLPAIVLGSYVSLNAQNGGELDPTFSTDGTVTFQQGGGQVRCSGLIIQDDQKIVVAGNSFESDVYYYPTLVRLNPDGTPDQSFGVNGMTSIDTLFVYSNDPSETLAIQEDGKLVMSYQTVWNNLQRIAVSRFNSDGTPDTTFDGDGTATNLVSGFSDLAQSMLIQDDGKIVVVGQGRTLEGDIPKMIATRFNTDGSVDETFGISGAFVHTLNPDQDNIILDAEQLADGRIVLLGHVSGPVSVDAVVLIRLNENGTIDSTFGTNGASIINLGSNFNFCQTLELDSEEYMLIGGAMYGSNANPDALLIKLAPDGTLDSDFGDGGLVITSFTDEVDIIDELKITSDGRILAVGHVGGLNGPGMVLRFNTDGTLDDAFGDNGVALIEDNKYRLENVKQQADGKIVVIGYNYDENTFAQEWRIDRLTYGAPNNISQLSGRELSLTVFPVPVQDYMDLTLYDLHFPCELFVYDMSGQCVSREKIWQSTTRIQTAHLAPGFYTLSVKSENMEVLQTRFVIAR